jgi:hypothetical protein
MSSLFQPLQRQELLARISQLSPESRPLWGKMNVSQMLHHSQAPLKVATGHMVLKQSIVGILFGRMAKKKLLQPGPFRNNLPTAPEFKVVEPAPDFYKEREILVDLIRQFGEAGPLSNRGKHPFFGSMSEEEWDHLQWKHLDHHLRQFGV